jgi:sec-independent protein translocase protein TatC
MATIIRGRPSSGSADDGGRMPLAAHLRELRRRVFISGAAVVVGMVVGLVFYEPLLALFTGPFTETVERLEAEQNLEAIINFDGIADPFTIPLRLAILSGIVFASPVWIYQLWAFIVPGLYGHERRWAMVVMLTAVPLFLGGVVLCYWVLPKGLGVLLGFTPSGVANIVSFTRYFSFVVRLLLVFGIAFLLPVFVVLLNAVGVFTGAALSSGRRWIVLGVFVFAALATPTGDPITMLMLAVPMWLLFEASVLVCRLNDRRRARASGEPEYAELSDDEASEIVARRDEDDDLASPLEDPAPGRDTRAD